MAELRAAQVQDVSAIVAIHPQSLHSAEEIQNASTSRVFTSTNDSNTPMRELLRSEGWHPSGVLTGLDEGDPEHVFFHDAASG